MGTQSRQLCLLRPNWRFTWFTVLLLPVLYVQDRLTPVQEAEPLPYVWAVWETCWRSSGMTWSWTQKLSCSEGMPSSPCNRSSEQATPLWQANHLWSRSCLIFNRLLQLQNSHKPSMYPPQPTHESSQSWRMSSFSHSFIINIRSCIEKSKVKHSPCGISWKTIFCDKMQYIFRPYQLTTFGNYVIQIKDRGCTSVIEHHNSNP